MGGSGNLNLATAAVSARDAAAREPEVVFYQLTRKFVDNAKSIPDEAADVMYYTLAVGHHTGVIDCFEERLRCTVKTYEQAMALFEEGGDARYKLEAITRSGEVQIEQRHLPVLLDPLDAAIDAAGACDASWDEASREPRYANDVAELLRGLRSLTKVLEQSAAAYIMGRVRIA